MYIHAYIYIYINGYGMRPAPFKAFPKNTKKRANQQNHKKTTKNNKNQSHT